MKPDRSQCHVLVSCLRINLNDRYLLHKFKGGMEVSFQFHHPKDAQACYRPQRGQRSVDRHKNARRCGYTVCGAAS
jgi:hypothetical protein